MAWALTLADTLSNSWPEFLGYISPAVVALLYATARWVESRARITSEVERSISRELDQTSGPGRQQLDDFVSDPGAPAQRKSSTKGTTSTSPGDDVEGPPG